MRLFVALDLPDPILKTLVALMASLKPAASIQWTAAANLHITTKFIGEWPEERLGRLKSGLAALPRHGPIPVHVKDLGWFPSPHSARSFWAGVHAPSALNTIAAASAKAAAELGLPTERRALHPHVTLARIKQPVDLAPLRQAVAALESVDFGAFEARSQFLYLSKLSVYTKLEEFPL